MARTAEVIQAEIDLVTTKISRLLGDELLQQDVGPGRVEGYENTATTLPVLIQFRNNLYAELNRVSNNGNITILQGVPIDG